MNKNLQNIDNVFFQHLEKYKEEPPEDAWHTIENELNKKDAALYKSKYLWLKKILICAVFLAAFLLLNNVLQPVLNKYDYKEEANFDTQQLNDPAVTDKSITPNKLPAYLLPGKSSYLKAGAPENKVNLSYEIDTSFSILNTQPANDERYLIAIEESNPVNFKTENPVQVVPQNQLLLFNDDKQILPVLNANKKSVTGTKQKHSFFIIPYFSIDHVTGHIKTHGQSGNSNLPPFKKEKLDLARTAGVITEKEISQKVSLQCGLLHSFWTKAISPAIVKALQDNSGEYKFKLSTDYGYAELKNAGTAQNGDSAIVTNGVVKLQSLSMPVAAVINVKNGRLKINTVTGGSVNFITRDVAEIEYSFANNAEKDNVQKLEGLRKLYITAVAGAEANYFLNKKISLGVSPVIRYAITPVNKSTLVKTYPVSLGVGASMRIKL